MVLESGTVIAAPAQVYPLSVLFFLADAMTETESPLHLLHSAERGDTRGLDAIRILIEPLFLLTHS